MDAASLHHFVEHYGYIAVLIGALLEGETILIIAGYLATQGYLNLAALMTVAGLGGFLGDQFFFMLGRLRGRQILHRFPRIRAKAIRVEALVIRNQNWLIALIRFLYGLRIAGPVLLGMSRVSPVRFAVINFMTAVVWAVLFGGAGYLFGEVVALLLHDAQRYEAVFFATIVAVAVGAWAFRRYRLAAKSRR